MVQIVTNSSGCRKLKTLVIISVISMLNCLPIVLSKSKDITNQVFSNNMDSMDVFPAVFSDYDGDKRIDLVVINKDFNEIKLYLGVSGTSTLSYPGSSYSCDIKLHSENGTSLPIRITGLNVADFTGDGLNDILVTFKYDDLIPNIPPPNKNKTKQTNSKVQNGFENSTFVRILAGAKNMLGCEPIILNDESTEKNQLRMLNEPIIADVNGDMIADLIGETENGQRIIWVFSSEPQPPTKLNFQCLHDPCSPIITGGFVDIDGDFKPDLVLVTKRKSKKSENDTSFSYYLEIYEVMSNEQESLKIDWKKSILITINGGNVGIIGNILFLDVALTGNEHSVILPFCQDKRCRNSGILLIDVKSEQVHSLSMSFSDDSGNSWTFFPPRYSLHPFYLQNINVRAGDYDLDGYPDLVTTFMRAKQPVSKAETRAILLKNVPCQGHSGVCTFHRTFEPNFHIFDTYTNVLSTAFYDSNENGLLDIIGVRRTSALTRNITESSFSIFVNENSPSYDAYFMKWTITSGICGENCPPYGVVLPGGTMKYKTMSLTSEIKSSRASQVFRPNFGLDLPGCLMGAGSSANFIDTVTFGGVIGKSTYTRKQIIPNSNLIVIPKEHGLFVKWEMKQLLRPNNEGILGTFYVLLFIFIINATLIIYLQMKERRIDRLDRHKDPLSMSALTMT